MPPVKTAVRFVERRTRGRASDPALGRRMVTGAPTTVRADLLQLAADYGVDELLVVAVTHDHMVRRRSYELLADAFSLRGAGSTATR